MTHDDLTLENLIERLPADPELWNLAATASTPEEERELRRLVEMTGLLSTACGEDAPAACRDRLFAEVRRQAVRRAASFPAPVVGAGAGPSAEPRPVRSRPAPAPVPIWALAAALTACALGLAFLVGRVAEQRHQIEGLRARVEEADATRAGLARQAEEMLHLRERLNMVTSVARYAYPMAATTVAAGSGRSRPEGIVYVCGAHRQWYLTLNGLEAPPEGRSYHLWFMTPEGPQSGGPLEVVPGRPVELEATTLPPGTRGFAVTLEETPEPAEPHGEPLLLADESVSL